MARIGGGGVMVPGPHLQEYNHRAIYFTSFEIVFNRYLVIFGAVLLLSLVGGLDFRTPNFFLFVFISFYIKTHLNFQEPPRTTLDNLSPPFSYKLILFINTCLKK